MSLATRLGRFRPIPLPEKNVGGRERVVRGVLGPTFVLLGIASVFGVITLAAGVVGTFLGVLVLVAGLRMTITAKTQKCYMNDWIGRNTYRPK
ncbi:MAG: DUF2892 domain-containing protein [Halobacteriales archaeon]|nr:DUF2892 domain-containing protein [Halobacteriales archaeon]